MVERRGRKLLKAFGVPQPYMITPTCEEEALYGKPVLLTPGEIDTLVSALKGSRKYNDKGLIQKLSR